jgi:flagellar biosynthesis/type III secretory pathway ATPase
MFSCQLLTKIGRQMPSQLRGTPARTVLRLAVRGIAGEVTIARPARLGIFRSRKMGRV